jgi:hypothetical protein
MAPRGVRVRGNWLEWMLPRRVRRAGRTVPLYRQSVRPSPELLGEFIALADIDAPRAIPRFVRRWGVLALCQHALPATHSGVCATLLAQTPLPYRDPLEGYRRYSRLARSIVSIHERLAAGRPGANEDWRIIEFRPSVRAEDSAIDQKTGAVTTSGLRYLPEDSAKRTILSQQREIADVVDEWLSMSGIRLFLSWDRAPQIGIGEGSLFGGLAVRLALMIAGVPSLVQCSNPKCRHFYTPSVYRPPRPGEPHYCPKCRHVPRQVASRKWRRRQRERTRSGRH